MLKHDISPLTLMIYLHAGSCVCSLSVSTALPNDSLAKSRSQISGASGVRMPPSGLGGAEGLANTGASIARFGTVRFSLLTAFFDRSTGATRVGAGSVSGLLVVAAGFLFGMVVGAIATDRGAFGAILFSTGGAVVSFLSAGWRGGVGGANPFCGSTPSLARCEPSSRVVAAAGLVALRVNVKYVIAPNVAATASVANPMLTQGVSRRCVAAPNHLGLHVDAHGARPRQVLLLR